MRKNKKRCSNKELYTTSDLYNENIFFIRTDIEQIARIKKCDSWDVWFYPYNLHLRYEKLTSVLDVIEKLFKEYWEKKYAKKQ